MAEQDQVGHAELRQRLEQAFARGVTTEAAEAPYSQQFRDLIGALGVSSYVCNVAFAGQASSGSFHVQVNVVNGGGFSSTWPQWAFDQARSALLHGKRLWVIANGDPFGSNVLQALILA